MSGNKYLLDTNFILALFKSNPIVIEELFSRQVYSSECFYSVVTRMELLGYPGITDGEESADEVIRTWHIRHQLSGLRLEPVLWESHGAPESSDRVQGILNKQIVDECDCAIFPKPTTH